MLSQDGAGVVTVHRLVQQVARTAQAGDAHRAPELIDQARSSALLLFMVAFSNYSTNKWPRLRQLAIQVVAFAVVANGRFAEMAFHS